jgi:hypothetical protein
MFNKLTAFAAAFALTASSALAGGLSPEIIESSPEEVVSPSPSVNPAYIVVGVLAALLIVAAVNGGDDGDDDDDDDGDGGDDQCAPAPTTARVAVAIVPCP